MNGWPKLDFYFKEVTATLAWGGYFFCNFTTSSNNVMMIARIINTMLKVSKVLIKLPSFP